MISGVEPYDNSFGVGFNARAMARPGYGSAWSLTVYAICGTALPGWQLSTAVAYGHGESNILQARVGCGGGRVVVGMGGMVVTGSRKVALAALIPGNESLVIASGQFDKTLGGLNPVFNMRASAVCAYRPPGWYLHIFGSGTAGPGGISLIDSCPAGKILGMGFSRGDVEGDPYMTNLTPLNLTTAQVAGRPRSPSNLWQLAGDLICAT
jgi:hypothetical protein